MRAARRGDAAAMDALVRELTPYVSRVCGAIALDRGDDAMQETFVAVLRNLRSLREPAAVYGWVRRIAVREAIRAARHDREDLSDPTFLLSAPGVEIDMATVLDVRSTPWLSFAPSSAPFLSCVTSKGWGRPRRPSSSASPRAR